MGGEVIVWIGDSDTQRVKARDLFYETMWCY